MAVTQTLPSYGSGGCSVSNQRWWSARTDRVARICLFSITRSRHMPERKLFRDSVTPLPTQVGLAPNGLFVDARRDEHKDEQMTLLFSLEPDKGTPQSIEDQVARGEVVSAERLQQAFGVD